MGRGPGAAAARLGAWVARQNAWKADVWRATEVGEKRFPPREAGLIAGIVERDLPFYDASIGEASVAAINDFARHMSFLDEDVPYSEGVATRCRDLSHSGGWARGGRCGPPPNLAKRCTTDARSRCS